MKHLKKSLFVIVAVGLLGVMFASFGAKQVHAAFAALVQVVNTHDNPVPVRDTRVTSSVAAILQASATEVQVFPAMPPCPTGTEFLVSSVNAAPDFDFSPGLGLLGAWGVRVNVTQKVSGGGANSRSILVYGNGPQDVSATLPAGQPAFSGHPLDILVRPLNGPISDEIIFVIHVSGYCGVAFVTP